ncbi:MAG: hypothetical protein U9R75_00645, partial [Candidatus Thermoplasmatota archaeon]|nr:hypothetical protein [Candidatus Thermoplasmatota archaeon]
LKNTLQDVFESGKDEIICIIGGFSSGGFRSDLSGLDGVSISLRGEELKVWTVVSEVLVTFRAS